LLRFKKFFRVEFYLLLTIYIRYVAFNCVQLVFIFSENVQIYFQLVSKLKTEVDAYCKFTTGFI